jgi:hypothetical protein
MLTLANKAILSSFASEKMAYQRVEKHVSAWCATKLYVPQEFARTFGKPFKSPGSSGSCQLIIITLTKD